MQEFCEPMATYFELDRIVTGFSEKLVAVKYG